ncbi:MAG TPA: cytosine permease, partial [Chitinophagaceae bacterium]|nr:cytosine permease [Chitinophagaceae bacterium]
FIRRQQLNVAELYKVKGQYSYARGFNRYALLALLLGILPNIPGFLTTTHMIKANAVPQWLSGMYNYAWFVGFFVSGLVYTFTMRHYKAGAPGIQQQGLNPEGVI